MCLSGAGRGRSLQTFFLVSIVDDHFYAQKYETNALAHKHESGLEVGMNEGISGRWRVGSILYLENQSVGSSKGEHSTHDGVKGPLGDFRFVF